MWFYYALLSAAMWGIGSILVKKGQSSLSPFADNVIATLIQVFLVAPFVLFFLGINLSLIPSVWLYAFFAAVLYMVFYYVISKGQISLTVPVFSSYPLVTIILSFLFLHETLTRLQILAVLMIISGTVILAFPSRIPEKSLRHPQKWFIWGIGGAIMIGIAELLTKIGTAHGGGNTFTFLLALFCLPAVLICAVFDKKGRNIKKMKWKSSAISLIGIAMIEFDLIPLNLAFATGPASLVSPVSTLNSLITVILAVKFLKERINKLQFLGIAITIIGTILIGGV